MLCEAFNEKVASDLHINTTKPEINRAIGFHYAMVALQSYIETKDFNLLSLN